MRLFMTAILWFVILGGTWGYVWLDNSIKREPNKIVYAQADGITSVQIERTFDCYGDPEFGEPALKVTFGGNDVWVDESSLIPAARKIEFELTDVEQQANSVTVYANAQSPDSFGDDTIVLRAMVVRILYRGHAIAERVFHDEGTGLSLGGDVRFEIDDFAKKDPHGH